MKNETKDQNLILLMEPYGYSGVAVKTTVAEIESALSTAKTMGIFIAQQILAHMTQHFKPALARIRKGKTYWDGQETIDRAKFDADMVWFAVYNQVVNGTPFAVSKIVQH